MVARSRPPSVERVLGELRRIVAAGTERGAMTAVARAVVDEERRRLVAGAPPREPPALAVEASRRLAGFGAVDHAVINATGVIVHTNLGRAPWPAAAVRAVAEAAAGALLLELDRETGKRGARFRQAEEHLIALTGS